MSHLRCQLIGAFDFRPSRLCSEACETSLERRRNMINDEDPSNTCLFLLISSGIDLSV